MPLGLRISTVNYSGLLGMHATPIAVPFYPHATVAERIRTGSAVAAL